MNLLLSLVTILVFILFAVPAALVLNALDWVAKRKKRPLRWLTET
jgi:hypothetical protein